MRGRRDTRKPGGSRPAPRLVDEDDQDAEDPEGDEDTESSLDAATGTAPSSVPAKQKRKKSDCMACQYGKPAAIGLGVGIMAAYMLGQEASRGALYGIVGGLLFGAVRG